MAQFLVVHLLTPTFDPDGVPNGFASAATPDGDIIFPANFPVKVTTIPYVLLANWLIRLPTVANAESGSGKEADHGQEDRRVARRSRRAMRGVNSESKCVTVWGLVMAFVIVAVWFGAYWFFSLLGS
jgi:hypothetical protein